MQVRFTTLHHAALQNIRLRIWLENTKRTDISAFFARPEEARVTAKILAELEEAYRQEVGLPKEGSR
jgi:hypothetical protein